MTSSDLLLSGEIHLQSPLGVMSHTINPTMQISTAEELRKLFYPEGGKDEGPGMCQWAAQSGFWYWYWNLLIPAQLLSPLIFKHMNSLPLCGYEGFLVAVGQFWGAGAGLEQLSKVNTNLRHKNS